MEVDPGSLDEILEEFRDVPHAVVGEVTEEPMVRITDQAGATIVSESLAVLKQSWQQPLAW